MYNEPSQACSIKLDAKVHFYTKDIGLDKQKFWA